ncbi:retrovirus-related pol polyprotein LINE-1 [Tanacetum coccineum]
MNESISELHKKEKMLQEQNNSLSKKVHLNSKISSQQLQFGLKEIEKNSEHHHNHMFLLLQQAGKWIWIGSDGHLRSCPSGLGGVVGCRETRRYDRLAGTRRIRVGTWNVGSLTGKRLELADALGRHKVDIACFQETKWKGSLVAAARVGFWQVISGLSKGRTQFTSSAPYARRIEEGRAILEFATAHDLVVANSFFKKREAHLITFQDNRQGGSEIGRGGFYEKLEGEIVGRDFKAYNISKKLSAFSWNEDMSLQVVLNRCGNNLAHYSKMWPRETPFPWFWLAVSSRTHSTHKKSWWFSEGLQTKVSWRNNLGSKERTPLVFALNLKGLILRAIDSATERVDLKEVKLGAQENRVEVAELRVLRWTCGKFTVDMIPNRVFRAELEVDSIIDKMSEGRLRWFGHLKKRPQTAPVRRVEALLVDGSRRRDLNLDGKIDLNRT